MIELLVRRRVLTTVLVLTAVLLGGLSYAAMGLRRFPEIEFPFVTVVTLYEGADPSEVETELTKPIEDAVITISGIETIRSTSQSGLSLVFIEFGLEEDVDIKAVEVRNKIDRISYRFPEGAEDPIPEKFEIGSLPILDVALYGPQDANDLYRLADEELEAMLTQVPGVADITLTGGQEREIQVLLEARKLRQHRVPIGAVVAALRASNVDVPAGRITQPGREYVLRAIGRVKRPEEIEAVMVPTAGEGTLTVGDLGRVLDTYEERRSASRFRGPDSEESQDAIIMSILARSDANEVEVADGVRALLPKMRGRLPEGAKLEVARDTSVFIRGALANVRFNMMLGICLTAVVLFLFLKSFRATFIAAIVMPTAVITAFLGMNASGFSLNIITLTGLAIVIGVLVNNAILILENANRFLDRGLPPVEAAVAGTKDIALAILSSTATNLVVFLPLAFMGEIIGRFFRELGLTVTYATVVSLAVSFSLTPMMCGLMLKANNSDKSGRSLPVLLLDATVGRFADVWRWAFEHVRQAYLGMLEWCLTYRKSTVLITLLAFLASFGVFGVVGMEFFPRQDEGRFRVGIEAPVGTPLAETDAIVRRVEEKLRDLPHLTAYSVKVGQVAATSTGRTEGVDLAEISVSVVDRALRSESLDELMNEARRRLAHIASARVLVAGEAGGPAEAPISVQVVGEDQTALERIASQVEAIVRETPSTAGVTNSAQSGQPELRVYPRQKAANVEKLNVRQISDELRMYVEGRVASDFLDGDEVYDVVVKLRDEDKAYVGDLERMFVSSPTTGNLLRIGDVSEVRREAGAALISRKDRTRLVTVTSNVTGDRASGKVEADIRRRIADEIRPPEGVSIQYGGEAEMRGKNFAELFKAMAIAAVLTFLCVAAIIESFTFAAIIIMALPVCLIGVSLAMLVTNVPVNIFSLMAMIILVGMVVNNAIIVVDYAMRVEAAGKPALEAVREACRERFRMIVMANLTTVVALIPLSLGLGFAGEVFRPLAIVQMGGVLAAAGLSLLVIPAVYVMVRGRRSAA